MHTIHTVGNDSRLLESIGPCSIYKHHILRWFASPILDKYVAVSTVPGLAFLSKSSFGCPFGGALRFVLNVFNSMTAVNRDQPETREGMGGLAATVLLLSGVLRYQ